MVLNEKVYQETTQPLQATRAPKISAARNINSTKNAMTGTTTTTTTTSNNNKRPSRHKYTYYNRNDKSDLGENFIAPDGGWAWLVCIAAGASNLSIYPCVQQFGFMFREHLAVLGFTSSQVTTIINSNPAISACTGLLNGPMFRRFTFRQVAIVGALFIFCGIVLTAFCKTFVGYMISYGLLYGFGMGISVSASSLAINTYFRNKRRRAAGFSWTITGLGPIVLPYFVTYLMSIYGVHDTLLIFAAISLHSFVCALIYQPVRYHAPAPICADETGSQDQPNELCKYCTLREKREKGIFSSQYLYQDDDADTPGYEIIEPGTPMLSRANDGWYGSRLSLASGKTRFRKVSSSKELDLPANRLNKIISEEEIKSDEFFRPNNFRRERDETLNTLRRQHSNVHCDLEFAPTLCTCHEERTLMAATSSTAAAEAAPIAGDGEKNNNENQHQNGASAGVDGSLLSATTEDDDIATPISFLQKVVTFFDLDLLRDFTFVNLVVGLTIINFGELNFSILTPFILADFGFDTPQITLATSILAGLDITMRFLIPFFTEKISWDNRIFFLIGVVGIALGRTVVACTRSYSTILCCFVWIGLCKGIRTIFWPLIIPGYVPLNRLPGASGLQLLLSGLFTLAVGPFVGVVTDIYDFSVTLHCLNMMSFIAAFSWTLEALIRQRRRKNRK